MPAPDLDAISSSLRVMDLQLRPRIVTLAQGTTSDEDSMSGKQDRLNLDAVIEALTPEQRTHLEDRARLLGFPRNSWTALPAEVTVAVSWATTAVANDLRLYHRDWTWNRCLDEAEVYLIADAYGDKLDSRPKSVRSTYARWKKAVEQPPDD